MADFDIDIPAVMTELARGLSELDSRLSQRFLEEARNATPDRLMRAFHHILKPAYIPVDGTGNYVAGIRICLPRWTDERRAALDAGDLNLLDFFGHALDLPAVGATIPDQQP